MNNESILNIPNIRLSIKYDESIESACEWWRVLEKEEYPYILEFIAKEIVSRQLRLDHIYTACLYSYHYNCWLHNFGFLDFLRGSEIYKKYFLGIAINKLNTDSERLSFDNCVYMMKRASIEFKDFTDGISTATRQFPKIFRNGKTIADLEAIARTWDEESNSEPLASRS